MYSALASFPSFCCPLQVTGIVNKSHKRGSVCWNVQSLLKFLFPVLSSSLFFSIHNGTNLLPILHSVTTHYGYNLWGWGCTSSSYRVFMSLSFEIQISSNFFLPARDSDDSFSIASLRRLDANLVACVWMGNSRSGAVVWLWYHF